MWAGLPEASPSVLRERCSLTPGGSDGRRAGPSLERKGRTKVLKATSEASCQFKFAILHPGGQVTWEATAKGFCRINLLTGRQWTFFPLRCPMTRTGRRKKPAAPAKALLFISFRLLEASCCLKYLSDNGAHPDWHTAASTSLLVAPSAD